MGKGKLIVLDGLDGCGKSTQLDLAVGYLKEQGIECRSVSFPNYDTITGQLVECYLRGEIPCEGRNGAYAASSFYAMDRYVSYITDWKRYYEQGGIIIAGRYTTSNAIYQLTKIPDAEKDAFLNWLYEYEYNYLGLPQPDLILFLDMPVEISQNLLTERYDGDESKKDIHERNVEFQKQCRESALYAARHGDWSVISCSENGWPRSIEEVYSQICGFLRLLMFDEFFELSQN